MDSSELFQTYESFFLLLCTKEEHFSNVDNKTVDFQCIFFFHAM